MNEESKKVSELSEDQKKFIELRSQGLTFASIAEQIKVSKRTLITWSRKFQFEIQNQRALELEALQAQYVATREERIRALGEQLRTVEAELKKRDIAEISTARLFGVAAALRREILKDDSRVGFTSPVNEIPSDEYHEQVQDWKG